MRDVLTAAGAVVYVIVSVGLVSYHFADIKPQDRCVRVAQLEPNPHRIYFNVPNPCSP